MNQPKGITLSYTDGSSNKIYAAQLSPNGRALP